MKTLLFHFTCLLIWMASAAFAAIPENKPIRVALYLHKDNSYYQGHHRNLLTILTPGKGFSHKVVTADDIQTGVLADTDILVMPGGSAKAQAGALGENGRQAIQEFVSKGGAYLGICAGAYLATNDYPWSLNLMNARVVDKEHWARGKGEVRILFSGKGKQMLGCGVDSHLIAYLQGPLLAPGTDKDMPAIESLATFSSEIAKNGASPGIMKGTTAIASAVFGKGRVICFSPHPELPGGPNQLILAGAYWVAGHPIPSRSPESAP